MAILLRSNIIHHYMRYVPGHAVQPLCPLIAGEWVARGLNACWMCIESTLSKTATPVAVWQNTFN